MTTRTFSISFSTDEEDFISRACPECGTRFKVKVVNGETAISSCPFCKHKDSRWETPEQIEYGKAFAAKEVLQPELAKLDRAFKSLGRAGGPGLSVKVTGSMPDLKVPPKPVERTEEMPDRTSFACCGAVVRHAPVTRPGFCPACGEAREAT
jgi:hypothetical protein